MSFHEAKMIFATALCLAGPSVGMAQSAKIKAPQKAENQLRVATINVSLLKAVLAHDVPRVKTLLDKGASPNSRDRKGQAALSLALKEMIPDSAEIDGARPTNKFDTKKKIEIAEALLTRGANPNVMSSNEETPLCAAAVSGSVSLVKSMITHGAKVNQASKGGATALMVASLARDGKIITLLLEHGAEVNAKDESGSTALIWVLLPSKMTGLKVSKSENSENAFKVLIDHGANVNVEAAAYTPLMGAAMSGDMEKALILLKKGAKVDGMGFSDIAPLPCAIEADQFEMAMMLLDHGANPNQTNYGGIPVLILAVDHNSLPLIEKLIKSGAKTNVVIHGIEGITPLEIARAKKLTAVIELFARLGVTK